MVNHRAVSKGIFNGSSSRSRLRRFGHLFRFADSGAFDDAGFRENFVGAVLINGLERSHGQTDLDEFVELRHPDLLVLDVGMNLAFHTLGDVSADTAKLLGPTAAVNVMSGGDFGTGDLALSGHVMILL